MKNSLDSLLTEDEIQPIDILCGRDKTCYNHIGNRRLRFLVAFNLERYKSSKTRKAKGKVEHSILKQIGILGGRFLERHQVNAGFWLPAPKKIVRKKISHALRNKNPIPELNLAKPMLTILTNNVSRECTLQTEHIFNEINATLLRAVIPEGECFNDQYVEDILMDELEEFINSRKTEHDCCLLQVFDEHEEELTRSNSLFQLYTKSSFKPNINKCNFKNEKMIHQDEAAHLASECAPNNVPRKPSHKGCSLELENEICDPFDKGVRLVSNINKCNSKYEKMTDHVVHLASESAPNKVTRKPNHKGCSLEFDNEICDPFDKGFQLERLPHNNFESTILTLNDEMLSVAEDLPKDFTETEFECLVASLDHFTND